jgi:hypothetical protein
MSVAPSTLFASTLTHVHAPEYAKLPFERTAMMPQNGVEKGIARIKSIAEDVYRTLGSGFSEDVYDRAMQVGLRLAKIPYEPPEGG